MKDISDSQIVCKAPRVPTYMAPYTNICNLYPQSHIYSFTLVIRN